MKRPPIVSGTFNAKGETSEVLRIPLGTVWPLYRVRLHKHGRGRVMYQARYDGDDWRDTWWGSVRSRTGVLEKKDGKECDVRLVCRSCPAPIDYALTYIRPDRVISVLRGRTFQEAMAIFSADALWDLVEKPDSPLFGTDA